MQKHDRARTSGRTFPGLGYAEDFTSAFLVSFGVVLFMALCVVVLVFGWLVLFLAVWSADAYMRRLLEQRSAAMLPAKDGVDQR